MIKIGLVDHHLNNWHSNTFIKILHEKFEEKNCMITCAYESDPNSEPDWCATNKVEKCATAEEVAEKSDCVMVLSPDNIECHLELCKKVFPYKKPVYIDKFLAPTMAESKEIIELANKYSINIMSGSALTFAVEIEKAISETKEPIDEVYTRGLSHWRAYGIHTLSMAIRLMGINFKRFIDTGNESSHIVTIDYGNGRMATVEVHESDNQWDVFKWEFGIRCGKNYKCYTVNDYDGFYFNLMREVEHFFTTGKSNFPVENALACVAIIEGAFESQRQGGVWIANPLIK